MKIPKNNSLFKIPIVEVAMIDDYSHKSHRNLKQLKSKWEFTKKNLQANNERLDRLQKEYLTLQKQAKIKDPKKITKITQRKKKLFKTVELFTKYNEIRKTLKYFKKLKFNREKILQSLIFFTISTAPNEIIGPDSIKFIKLAKAYHERWGIKNGFKEDKSKFIRSVRYRKSTKRQWNLELGMMSYNQWHVCRMAKMLAIKRKMMWNYVPWDPQQPFFRRRIEQEHGDVLSAEAYLLQILEYGVKLQLQKIFER